jgi:hypothetical protein
VRASSLRLRDAAVNMEGMRGRDLERLGQPEPLPWTWAASDGGNDTWRATHRSLPAPAPHGARSLASVLVYQPM